MLEALRNQDPREATQILAGVTQSFLPDPGIDPAPLIDAAQARIRDQVLEEIRLRLRLPATDQSHEARTKIIEYLSTAMKELILPPSEIPIVRARLGQRGDLFPPLYRVQFGDSFKNHEQKRGIRQNHVERALLQPDDVQHLLREQMQEANYPAISLYLKRHGGQNQGGDFFLLVATKREKDIQRVESAWRIYPSDVDVSKAHTPLDILRAFVERYGIPIKVGNSEPNLFFLYTIVPRENTSESVAIISSSVPKGSAGEVHAIIRVTSEFVEVGLAYAINISNYNIDLRKHGVQVSE